MIKLGDQVTVQVHKVDTFKKQVDFRLVSVATKGKKRPGKPAFLQEPKLRAVKE